MFYLAQAGSTLKAIKTDGTVVALSLPTGITIDATIRGRFVTFNQQIFFIRAGLVNLWIDPFDLTVRPMNIRPPVGGPALAAGSGTGLTGAYRGQVAFYVKNANGQVVNLSPLSPLSLSAPITNKNLNWTNIPVSPDASQFVSTASPYIFGRRLFRTLAGGTDTFEALDIDDNITTAIVESMPDASLSILPASEDLGIPPGSSPGTSLSLITSWKNRLWGVSARADAVDLVFFTEIDEFYGWNPDNFVKAQPIGADAFGVTGFLPRRDTLGMCKRDRLVKVIGTTPDDFEVVTVSEHVSCIAPESCLVIRDVAYFLGLDGVYRWDDNGVVNISNAQVNPWFTRDDVFNRSRFPLAYAGWNPLTNAYELHLAAAGSSAEDRWIAYHIDKGQWMGPHKTGAFTPTCAQLLEDGNDVLLPAMGASDGYVYLQNQSAFSDTPGGGAAGAIDAQARTRFLQGPPEAPAPDIEHHWGKLSMLARVETGGTLTITPYLGGIDAAAGSTLAFDLTTGRARLDRVGQGRLCSLAFSQAAAGHGFLLFGFEIDPVFEIGRR